MPPRASQDDSVPRIWVQGGPAVRPGHVAFSDKDPLHPNGEVYVASPHPDEEPMTVEVARTAAVMQALGQQRITEVPSPKGAEADELREQQARSSTSLSRPSAAAAAISTPTTGTGAGTARNRRAGQTGSENDTDPGNGGQGTT